MLKKSHCWGQAHLQRLSHYEGRMGAVTHFSLLVFSSSRALDFGKYNFIPKERY